MKKITLAALAAAALFYSVNAEDVAPTGDAPTEDVAPTGDTPTEDEPTEDVTTFDESFYGMPIVHPDGWSPMVDDIDPAVSSATVAGGEDEPAEITLVRGTKPTDDEVDPWPEASLLGAMFTEEGDNSLKALKEVIVTYTVIEENIGTADAGLSFAISTDYSIGIESAGYAKFHAVLTKGIENLGDEVSDTIGIADISISYESDDISEGTNLESDIGQTYLATANGFAFGIESEKWDADQSIKFSVKSVEFLGDDGLKTDMGLDANSISFVNTKTASISNVITSITASTMNLNVPTSGEYTVSILAANGRVINSFSTTAIAGVNSINWNGANYSSSIYFVNVKGAKINQTTKVSINN
jgi:hypothetical protein